MYNRFFGFTERPFKLVPNPAFLYLSRIHEEVLAHLTYAVGFGEGFVEVTGEVGTGKTTLCRMFLESLDENTEAAYIFNPKLDVLQLLKSINDEFGISSDTDSTKTLIDQLNDFLLDQKSRGKRVLLLIDEAQNLSPDVLEQLRLLSNLETTTSKLLQIILVGQPELGELLETDALRQLNQRITLSCHLIPLSNAETRAYIRHRIHVASEKPGLEFTGGAFRTIFKHTGGTPRLINIVCDRALLTAYARGKHRITQGIVKQALRELDNGKWRAVRTKPFWAKLALGLLAVLAIGLVGVVARQALVDKVIEPVAAPVAHHKIETAPEPEPPGEGVEEEANQIQTKADVANPSESMPPPTIAPVGPEAPAPPPDRVRDLAAVLTDLEPFASRTGALAAVLNTWDAKIHSDFNAVADNDTFFRIAARHSNMETLRVKGNLNLIRKLNLPAIVAFDQPGVEGPLFLAVTGMAAEKIRVSDGDHSFLISPASLTEKWNGTAHIFWKNFFNYTGVIPITAPGEAVLSLKVHLASLGFVVGEMNAAYDAATRQAVEWIQAQNGLDVDAMVGPQTMIVLYNMDATLNIPRLDTALEMAAALPADEEQTP
jgi:general secretion pathway protein A